MVLDVLDVAEDYCKDMNIVKDLYHFSWMVTKGLLDGVRTDVVRALHEAAANRKKVTIRYQKLNGDVKEYYVAPYSFRTRSFRTKSGRRSKRSRRYFYGYDFDDGTIKAFVLSRIKGVRIMSKSFRPKWDIELGVI